jgi:hypothetical protein
MASMLVGEGEDGIRLFETAVATADVSVCQGADQARKSSRKALAKAALDLLTLRATGCLAAPTGIEPFVGCVEDDDLKAAGLLLAQLEQMISGPDRDRVREWLIMLPSALRIVFVLRAVGGFSTGETVALLVGHGGPEAADWNEESVRTIFRLGFCSLASQLLQSSAKS